MGTVFGRICRSVTMITRRVTNSAENNEEIMPSLNLAAEPTTRQRCQAVASAAGVSYIVG